MTGLVLRHLQALVGDRHPRSNPQGLAAAETYILQQFAECGLTISFHEFEGLGGTYRNIIGIQQGTQGDGRVTARLPLIVAAHLDTVPDSPGADDNASALAVLLEVAWALRHQSLMSPVRFIAFNLEEDGLLGSRAYVAGLQQRGEQIAGALVLECVGYASQIEGSQQIPPGVPIPVPTTGNFLAIIGNQRSAGLVTAIGHAAKQQGLTLPMVPLVVPGNGELLPDTRRSDHSPFWDAGYPAVMLTDTANLRNPHYHQSTDTIETLDLSFIEQVAAVVTATVLRCTGSVD